MIQGKTKTKMAAVNEELYEHAQSGLWLQLGRMFLFLYFFPFLRGRISQLMSVIAFVPKKYVLKTKQKHVQITYTDVTPLFVLGAGHGQGELPLRRV